MKVINCEQGTEEWIQSRLGKMTSSCFDTILTTKGDVSKQKTKYLYRLAGEFVSGQPEETYQSAAMIRGSEMEAEARSFYEVAKGVQVKEVGFCLDDSEKYGASPDGLVGDEGLVEIKCPTLPVHVEYLIGGKLPTKYFQQVQGQMLVTGRKWVDFISYYPAIKPLVVRVERDEVFLKKLEKELVAAYDELQKIILLIQ